MVTYKGLLSFMIGFLIAGLCVLFITGVSWGACVTWTQSGTTRQYMGTSDHPVPKTVLPGASGCSDLSARGYLQVYGTNLNNGSATDVSGWKNCGDSDGRGEWWVCWQPGCNSATWCCNEIIYQKVTTDPNPSTYDYDCDTVPDASDTQPANDLVSGVDTDGDGIDDAIDPWPNDNTKPGSRKFVNKLSFVNKATGVTYKRYEDVADPTTFFWTSSDGSSIPSSFADASYRAMINIYGGADAGGLTFAQIQAGFGSGSEYVKGGQGAIGSTSGVVPVTGGETNTTTSPGRSQGGDTGAFDPNSGSTNDYKEMFSYLQGIQRNTKATADTLVQVDSDLQKIKQNQAGGALAGSGQQTGTDMSGTISAINQVKSSTDAVKTSVDNTKTSVDNIKTSVDALKTDMDTQPTGDLPDGDTSTMEDNSDIDEGTYETRFSSEGSSLATYMTNFINSSPIASIVSGSGVLADGGSSSVSVSAGQYGFSLNFSGCESALSIIGDFFVAFCALAGLVTVLRD